MVNEIVESARTVTLHTNVGLWLVGLGLFVLGFFVSQLKRLVLRWEEREERAELDARRERHERIIREWQAEQQGHPHGAEAIAEVAAQLAPTETADCDGPPECEACLTELQDPDYTCDEVGARASALVSEIERANRFYYSGEPPELSDSAYSRLLGELRELERRHPELRRPDSPTRRADDFPRPASIYLNPKGEKR